MKTCKECGLPLAACNAFATYRLAVEAFQRGKTESANDLAASAKGWHDKFMSDWQTETETAARLRSVVGAVSDGPSMADIKANLVATSIVPNYRPVRS